MYLRSLLCSLAVLSATGQLDPFPALQEQSDQVPVPTDYNLLIDAVGFIPEDTAAVGLRHPRSLSSAFSVAGDRGVDPAKSSWWKGAKATLSDDSSENRVVEDVKSMLWKLAGAERTRSPTFIRVNQAVQKPNKRACFWKYCVTK
ncbi:hypothetical protein NDU88_007496 [Pleurodeles waltl]|uniref:Urotensin II n=1 Tax=Pleurodeles waltl TaxID=8319 RepID=A0AAV7MFX8_PLEWA|nr:hypothetical protein NDU88_007496 [Pleurodeles waltl]